ncbi:hypothetical protein AVEN_76700-1 [Araneus ventricosus]|uniref:Uncharacterized protein n=1 Tax=Araneus ventricosus TaxID=182803 RepID=A0A4Y2BQQ5_ARAVE|nr:hypothetical protein AVEN_76700-1 [Araneus ventricosus]
MECCRLQWKVLIWGGGSRIENPVPMKILRVQGLLHVKLDRAKYLTLPVKIPTLARSTQGPEIQELVHRGGFSEEPVGEICDQHIDTPRRKCEIPFTVRVSV